MKNYNFIFSSIYDIVSFLKNIIFLKNRSVIPKWNRKLPMCFKENILEASWKRDSVSFHKVPIPIPVPKREAYVR